MTYGIYDNGIRYTVVSGSSYTGVYALDGSINVVLDDPTYKGLYHPCGAFRVNSDTSVQRIYDASGAYYLGTLLGRAGTSGPSFDFTNYAGDGASWTTDHLSYGGRYIPAQDTTAVVWQGTTGFSTPGSQRIIWCRGYNHTTQSLTGTYLVGTTTRDNDAHGNPAMAYNANTDRLYCAYGTHNDPQQVSVSGAACDITTWTPCTAAPGIHTYPKLFFPTAGANVGVAHLISRNNAGASNGGAYQLQIIRSTAIDGAGLITWEAAATPIIDLGTDSRCDPGVHVLDPDGHSIRGVACRPNNPDGYRQDVYYFIYDTNDGKLYNADRSFSTSTFPVDITTMNTNYRMVDQTDVGKYGSVPTHNLDSTGKPHVLYFDGPINGPWNYVHTMYNGTSWTSPVIVGSTATLPTAVTHRFEGLAVVPLTGGDVDLYIVTQSTTPYARGGDISKVTRTAAGAFSSLTTVQAADATYALDAPSPILSPHANLRVIIGQTNGDETVESTLNGYAYGDSGLIKYNYSSISRALFAVLQPLSSQKFAIDDLITTLDAKGIWSAKMELFYWALNDETSAFINWANPGNYTLTKVSTPTFTAKTDFKGNGTSTKYATGFTPSVNGTKISQNSMALGVGSRINTANDSYFDIGGSNTKNAIMNSGTVTGGGVRGAINNATNVTATNSGSATGQTVLSRTASNATSAYRNAVLCSTDATASTGVCDAQIYICGTNAGWSARSISDAWLSAGLTASDVAALYYARMRCRVMIGML